MNTDELKTVLDLHAKWLRDDPDGLRADLTDADLSSADLSSADLTRAYLTGAYLSSADLTRADLSGANLTDANLSGANLSGANLTDANLSGADLTYTCLSTNFTNLARTFARECKPTRRGGRIVYRTAISRHIGKTEYNPGHTYIAPVLSWSVETDCHPGIYAASLEWMRREYPGAKLVRCYVRDGDWTITAKGAIRCERLRVLGYVND